MIIAIANVIGRSGGFRSDGNVPVNTVAPVISGSVSIGSTLTSTTGTWTSDTGVIGYLYQWYRGDLPISGATSNSYILVTADLYNNVVCKVAATDTDGTSAYVSSNTLLISGIPEFMTRVIADGGVFEAESCLLTQLESLV